jgi:hypothetical protein
VFGGKLEKLDTLRVQDKVWITLLQNEGGKWQIEIAGHDIVEIEVAKEHFHTLIDQVRADATGIQQAYNVILDEREGIQVELRQDEEWWPNHVDRVVPRLLPHQMMDEPGSFRQDGVQKEHVLGIEAALKRGLDNVRHKKGAYDFIVRLGCLALNSKHVSDGKVGQTFTKDTFLKDINGPIGLDVKKW